MPTTATEAETIIDTSRRYLPLRRLHKLFVELDERVGQHTDNSSVRESFAMFRALTTAAVYREQQILQTAWAEGVPRWFLLSLWGGLVLLHLGLSLACVVAAAAAVQHGPWYFAVPTAFVIFWVACSASECPLTRWENKLRRRLGWEELRGFLGYYLLDWPRQLLRGRCRE